MELSNLCNRLQNEEEALERTQKRLEEACRNQEELEKVADERERCISACKSKCSEQIPDQLQLLAQAVALGSSRTMAHLHLNHRGLALLTAGRKMQDTRFFVLFVIVLRGVRRTGR